MTWVAVQLENFVTVFVTLLLFPVFEDIAPGNELLLPEIKTVYGLSQGTVPFQIMTTVYTL